MAPSSGDGYGLRDASDPCNDFDHDGFGELGVVAGACALDNCPRVVNTTQADADFDGRGNVCDPCTNVVGAQTIDQSPELVLRKVGLDIFPGNDSLRLRGEFWLPPEATFADLDPRTNGARLLTTTTWGGTALDEMLPPGELSGRRGSRGWSLNGGRNRWKYRDKSSTPVNGIRKVFIDDRSRLSPGLVRIVISGKRGTYQVGIADSPVNATFVLGGQPASEAGLCGETAFAAERCRFNRNGQTIGCR